MYRIGGATTCLISGCSICSWPKSHSESFWHLLGWQEKLLAFVSHLWQKAQGISVLLFIVNMNMLCC